MASHNINANPALTSKQEIDNAVNDLTLKLKRDIEKSSKPGKTFTINRLPNNIREEIKLKNRLQKEYQRTLYHEDKLLWNRACKKVNKLIKDYKQQSWESTVMELSTHNSSIWRMSRESKALVMLMMSIGEKITFKVVVLHRTIEL